MSPWWLLPGAGVLTLIGWSYLRSRGGKKPPNTNAAAAEFRLRREWLEAEFMQIASNSGLPRGLRWKNCDFENEVLFARDKKSGDLTALVAVTIAFEAIEGGPMEDVPAVGNLRLATAVFLFSNQQWRTDGKAVFNLDPLETLARFEKFFERVELTESA